MANVLDLSGLLGQVRETTVPNYADLDAKVPAINDRGELIVSQGLPERTELVRLGNSWTCSIATANAFTYVNAWPTTRAELVIYNGDPAKSLVFDAAWMVDISSAAAAQSKALIAQLALTGIAAPTDDTAQLIYSRSGRRSYGGYVKRALANTAFALANKWEVLAVTNNVQAASIGAGLYTDMPSGWIVPPGGALCLAGVASTAAGTAIIGATWHEVLLPLG